MLKSVTFSPVQGSVGNGSASRGGIFVAREERGLGHLQRREDALGQERSQTLGRDDLDDAAEDVGGAAVVPLRAGLADQRKFRHQGRVLGIGDLAAAQPRLLVELLHQAVAGVVVGDARRVPQQVLDRDRPLDRHQFQRAVGLDADLLVGKLRDEFCDRICQQEMPVLQQHHDADRHDRLGHGIDAEDRIVGHWRSRGRALSANGLEPADLAPPPHHEGDAGDGSLVDLALQRVGGARQAGRGKSEGFGPGLGQGRGVGGRGLSGGGLGVHGLSRWLLLLGQGEVWRRSCRLNRVETITRAQAGDSRCVFSAAT